MIFFRMLEKINRNSELSDEEKDRRGRLVEDCWFNHGKDFFKLKNKTSTYKINAKTVAVFFKFLEVTNILMYAYEGLDYKGEFADPKKVSNFLIEMGELPPNEEVFDEF